MINKVFILAGGGGNRIKLGQKQNIKAFIDINGEELLERHIRLVNEYIKPKQIYVLITEFFEIFNKHISKYKNVTLLLNDNIKNKNGIELLLAIEKINQKIFQNEKTLILLVDEYYSEDDFKIFSEELKLDNFSLKVAIKKLEFPDEYLKNYSVTIDKDKSIVTSSLEKSQKIQSEYFGTGLICVDKEFTEMIVENIKNKNFTPIFSLLNKSKSPSFFILKNIYSNINTRVDIYELQKKIRKTQTFTIDVVIPSYREEDNIAYVIKDFKDVVNNVIVANKHSEDKTEKIALKLGAKVISDNYQGYGHALKSGIESSNSDIVVLAEADGTFRSSDLEKLINNLMDNDVVQGTRTNPAYIQYKANMDRPRIFFNKLYANIISLLWPKNKTHLTDVGCTYRAFWKNKYNKIKSRLISDSAAFAPELTIEFINQGCRVVEIPVNYHPRNMGESKLSGTYFKSAITALKMMKIILIKRLQYFFKEI